MKMSTGMGIRLYPLLVKDGDATKV